MVVCNSVLCRLTVASLPGINHSHEWSFCVDHWFGHHGALLKWNILTHEKCHYKSLKRGEHLTKRPKQQASSYKAAIKSSVHSPGTRCIFFVWVSEGSQTQIPYFSLTKLHFTFFLTYRPFMHLFEGLKFHISFTLGGQMCCIMHVKWWLLSKLMCPWAAFSY